MPKRSYSEDQKQEALALFEQHGQAEAERRTKIPRNTIASWARRAGVQSLHRKNMREANETKRLSNAERRAQLIEDLYDEAQERMSVLKRGSGYWTLIKGTQGRDKQVELGFIPSGDRLREKTSIGISLQRALDLEKVDQASENQSAVDAWLDHITGGDSAG